MDLNSSNGEIMNYNQTNNPYDTPKRDSNGACVIKNMSSKNDIDVIDSNGESDSIGSDNVRGDNISDSKGKQDGWALAKEIPRPTEIVLACGPPP